MIVIVDYKLGNLGSIKNMLDKIGVKSKISSNRKDIISAKKIILPGVGSFDNGMKNLEKLNLIEILNKVVIENKTPVLGICLGMQLMGLSSEEGSMNGLSWINLRVKSFKSIKNFTGTIPLMGWNYVACSKSNSILEKDNRRFYFVHEFHFEKNNFQIIEANIHNYSYCAGFQKGNIFGVQFHPEKSHIFGMDLLKNFSEL